MTYYDNITVHAASSTAISVIAMVMQYLEYIQHLRHSKVKARFSFYLVNNYYESDFL